MSRNKGTFDFSNNFEVRARSPLDAKQRVGTLSDLTSPTQWQSNTGDEWTYPGMIVSVYNDGVNNGVYRLNAVDYTIIGNWDKLGGSGDISALSTALSNEISNRAAGDSTLSTNLSSEVSTRSAADITLSSAISSEISSRSAGDSTLSSNLSSEVSSRSAGDSTLSSNLSTEISNRAAGDSTLSSNISTEISNRAAGDSTLSSNLSSEVSSRISGDSNITNNQIGGRTYTRPRDSYTYGVIYNNETVTSSLDRVNEFLYPFNSQWYETYSSSNVHWYYGTATTRMSTQYSSTAYYVTCNRYGKWYTMEISLYYTVPAAADGKDHIYIGPFPEIQPGLGSPYFWSGSQFLEHLYYGSHWYITRSSISGESTMITMWRADGGHFNSGQAYGLNFRTTFPTY
jgi:hypothetical protein